MTDHENTAADPDRTAADSLRIAAGDASPQTPLKVFVQAGHAQGLSEVGTIYYPAQLPDVLRQLADRIEKPGEE